MRQAFCLAAYFHTSGLGFYHSIHLNDKKQVLSVYRYIFAVEEE